MPEGWHEFTGRELGAVLGVSAGDAEEILDLASALEVNLPGTKAAFRAGILSRDKAAIIAAATALLDPAEARAAEAMVLDRAGSLTPAQLRAAIRRAVMEVNPGKARKRREHMAKRTRVERWAEDSGNAGPGRAGTAPGRGAGRRPAGHRLGPGAAQGGPGGRHGPLRARAFLDILLGTDSRPLAGSPDEPRTAPGPRQPRTATGGPGDRPAPAPDTGPAATPAPAGPLAGVIPPGFAGRVTLTIPVTTLLDLADRPGETGRPRPHRPRPGPRPGRRRGPQPPLHLVRDRHRQPGPRHRPRLRPARTRRQPR